MSDDEKREVTTEHVQEAVDDLRERGLFTDTSPGPDGRRGPQQWLNAIREDAALVHLALERSLRRDEDVRACLASAQKEAARMEKDVYRFAEDVHGISAKELNDQRFRA